MLIDGQLNLFEQINPTPSVIVPETVPVDPPANGFTTGESFAPGMRVKIVKAGVPFQYLNGQKGMIVGLMSDAISVQVEDIAVALMFRPEALEKWTPISEYTAAGAEADSVVLFRAGDRVECHAAFIGHVGTVSKMGVHCGVPVAWVDYGKGKPLYPCSLEQLTQAD